MPNRVNMLAVYQGSSAKGTMIGGKWLRPGRETKTQVSEESFLNLIEISESGGWLKIIAHDYYPMMSDGTFSLARYDDLRITSESVDVSDLQIGPNPIRMPSIFSPGRDGSYGGIGALRFRNYAHPFWQSCSFCCQMPHAWEEGTPIEPHLHFSLIPGTLASQNMFDPAWIQQGSVSTNNGNITGGSGFRSSLFSVQPSTVYSLSCSSASLMRIFWYDEGGDYLSYTESVINTTSPAGAHYARIWISSVEIPQEIQFEAGATVTPYSPYGFSSEPAAGQVLLLEFEWVWLNINEVMPETTNTALINYTVKEEDIAKRHFLVSFPTMEKPDGRSSSMITGRFSRIRKDDAWTEPVLGDLVNDNFQGDLVFLEWDFHYRIHRTGTKTSYPVMPQL